MSIEYLFMSNFKTIGDHIMNRTQKIKISGSCERSLDIALEHKIKELITTYPGMELKTYHDEVQVNLDKYVGYWKYTGFCFDDWHPGAIYKVSKDKLSSSQLSISTSNTNNMITTIWPSTLENETCWKKVSKPAFPQVEKEYCNRLKEYTGYWRYIGRECTRWFHGSVYKVNLLDDRILRVETRICGSPLSIHMNELDNNSLWQRADHSEKLKAYEGYYQRISAPNELYTLGEIYYVEYDRGSHDDESYLTITNDIGMPTELSYHHLNKPYLWRPLDKQDPIDVKELESNRKIENCEINGWELYKFTSYRNQSEQEKALVEAISRHSLPGSPLEHAMDHFNQMINTLDIKNQ